MISKSGRFTTDLLMPSLHLVVSEQIAKGLECFPHVKFYPVIFKKLIDIARPSGELTTWYEQFGDWDFHFLRKFPDCPDHHRTIGKYYEMITWRNCDIQSQYPEARDAGLAWGDPHCGEVEIVATPLSERMLRDYPILAVGELLFIDDVFKILDKHLDRDYFYLRHYEIEGSQVTYLSEGD